jgi:cytochrome P450
MVARPAARQPSLAMRRDPRQPLDPAPELLAVDDAGGVTEISMPIATPGPGRTWLVTRFDDVRAVLADPELFSNVLQLPSGGPGGTISPTGPGSLPGLDPPQHTRLRRLVSAEFSARRVAGLQSTVEATVDDALAGIRGRDRTDLVATIAQPIPAVVIAELLGVPPADRAEFCRRSGIAIDTRLPALARAENRAEMLAYMGQLVARLRAQPGDGLLGALITRHDSGLSDAELIATGNMLLLAGHETTASLIAQSLLLLIQRPDHRETVLHDEASLVRGVEELLRYLTVFHFSFPRTARRATTIAGTAIEAGDRILCSFPAAHRDRRRFPDADAFLPLRETASHLAFGHGIHYCIGAPLARLEMRTVLRAFFSAFPGAEIDSRTDPRYRDGSLAFGLETLPVVLRPIAAATRQAEPSPVPFQGCSQRSGPVSWAQASVWQWISQGLAEGLGTNYDLRFSVKVPSGTAVGDFLTAIGRMVSRHESLRTKFQLDAGHLVRQDAVGAGLADVTRYRVPTGHATTDELLRSWVGREMLDVTNNYPFRAGFVAAGGVVTHAAFVVSLIIADAAACENLTAALMSELSAISGGGTAPQDPVFQQLDQAEWEISAEGLRAEHRALEYWREQLAAIRRLPRPTVIDHGTIRSVVVPADSILTAAGDVARTSGISSSAVILTAFLEAVAHTLGLDGFGYYLNCSNRTDQGRRSSITRLKNMTVCVYAPGPADFRSRARQVFRDSLHAYRHAQSPGVMLLPRLGVPANQAPFVQFNDVRSVVTMDRPVATAGPAAPALSVRAEIPSLDSHTDSSNPQPVLILGVGPVLGVGPLESSGKPSLRLETNVLPADDIPLLLRRMDRVLGEAVTGRREPPA